MTLAPVTSTASNGGWLALLLALPLAAGTGALALTGALRLAGVEIATVPIWFGLLLAGLGWLVFGQPDRWARDGLTELLIWLAPGLLAGFGLASLASIGLLIIPFALLAAVVAGVMTKGRGLAGLAIGTGLVGLGIDQFFLVGLIGVGLGVAWAWAGPRLSAAG